MAKRRDPVSDPNRDAPLLRTGERHTVNEEDTIFAGHQAVLKHFRWIDGAADTWSMLRSAESLSLIVAGLAALVDQEPETTHQGSEHARYAKTNARAPHGLFA